MPKKMKNKMLARGRGGMQTAGVGADIGNWLEEKLLGWLGLAMGGDVKLASLDPAEKKALIKEAEKDLKAEIAAGNVPLPANSVGGDIGQWVGDWAENWLRDYFGFARGGQVGMARGGMVGAKQGHSVFR